MAVPTLTPEQRAAALAKAAEARKIRAAVKADLKTGRITLAQVLDQADRDPDIVGKIRILQALTAMRFIGPARAHEILTDLDIAPTRRLRCLGHNQRAALLERFGLDAD